MSTELREVVHPPPRLGKLLIHGTTALYAMTFQPAAPPKVEREEEREVEKNAEERKKQSRGVSANSRKI